MTLLQTPKQTKATVLLIVALLLSLSACSNSDGINSAIKQAANEKTSEVSSKNSLPVFDPATATGRVSGSIDFEGARPEAPTLTIGGDPLCKMNAVKIRDDKALLTPTGAVRNVIVYVRSGFEGRSYTPPAEPVVIDQQGCVYTPHVFSVMKGQKVRILNSDDVFHNVHAQEGARTEFNIAQAKAGAEDVKTFSRAAMPFRIGCDFHRWMSAYGGVFEHPFHTTTGNSGRYELHLPPGKYEIVAWHEELGEQAATVEVPEKKPIQLNFKFTASSEHRQRRRN